MRETWALLFSNSMKVSWSPTSPWGTTTLPTEHELTSEARAYIPRCQSQESGSGSCGPTRCPLRSAVSLCANVQRGQCIRH